MCGCGSGRSALRNPAHNEFEIICGQVVFHALHEADPAFWIHLRSLTQRHCKLTHATTIGERVLLEDRASGTQLLQELVHEGVYAARAYKTDMDKIMRLYSVCSTIENGFVHLPDKAEWLALYLHELTTFPKGKHDDQVDSTSQALDWLKQRYMEPQVRVFQVML